MPVITVKVREGVLDTSEKKAQVIRKIADAFAEVAGDESRREQILDVTTVLIEEIPDNCWGRKGRQVAP